MVFVASRLSLCVVIGVAWVQRRYGVLVLSLSPSLSLSLSPSLSLSLSLAVSLSVCLSVAVSLSLLSLSLWLSVSLSKRCDRRHSGSWVDFWHGGSVAEMVTDRPPTKGPNNEHTK